jgi:hypothetical protein
MWDGRKWETGLTPKYEDWCEDRDEPVIVSPRSRTIENGTDAIGR